MKLADYEAFHVKLFIEENWSEFVDKLSENYETREEAEEIAQEICDKLA
ncbi:hypothetical protein [Staphylococcus aureus]|nr:hypothetical protein [Staphylococcus aureus]